MLHEQALHYDFTDNPRTTLAGLSVISVGSNTMSHRQQVDRTLPHWVISYIIRGNGHFSDSNRQCLFGKGDCLLLHPDQHHYFAAIDDKGWDARSVRFVLSDTAFQQAYPSGPYTPADGKRVLKYFTTMLDIAHAQEAQGQNLERLPALLASILSEIRVPAQQHTPTASDPVEHILSIINTSLESIDYQSLATEHGISYALFRRECKKRTGLSPHRYHTRHRLKKSCELLLQGHSVQDAAQACGYNDPYHFSRLFKQHIGVAPSAYKKTPLF